MQSDEAIDHVICVDNPLAATAETLATEPAPVANSDHLCAISNQRMRDPVTLIGDRTTYERTVLDLWLLGIDGSDLALPHSVSPTTGLRLPVPDPLATVRRSPLLVYQPNQSLRSEIWELEPTLERSTSTDSEYATPRGTEEMEISMREQVMGLVRTVSALPDIGAALRRQPSQQEEEESVEARWDRLTAAEARCAEWWEGVSPIWQRARAMEERERASTVTSKTADQLMIVNVNLCDGKVVQLSVLPSDSVRGLIARVAWMNTAGYDGAPADLLDLYFSGVRCAREDSVGETGAADEAFFELRPAEECETAEGMRRAMVRHEQELMVNAFREVQVEMANAERDREQAEQQQQRQMDWRDQMPQVVSRARCHLWVAVMACLVNAVGVGFAVRDNQLLAVIQQALLIAMNIAIGCLCLGGLWTPVLDSPDAPFPWPLPVVDWPSIGFAIKDGRASRRTTVITLAVAVYSLLTAGCGVATLWHDPPSDGTVTPWIVLACMIVSACTLAPPLLLAALLKLARCAKPCYDAGVGVPLCLALAAAIHLAIAVMAAVFGSDQQGCVWSSSASWAIFAVNSIHFCAPWCFLCTLVLRRTGDRRGPIARWCDDLFFVIFLSAGVLIGWCCELAAFVYALAVLLTSGCAEGDDHLTALVIGQGVAVLLVCAMTLFGAVVSKV